MTPRTLYMHTWQGHPAWFHAKDRAIYVAGPRRLVKGLATSLAQIRREQAADQQKVRERGWEVDTTSYGYVRVRIA